MSIDEAMIPYFGKHSTKQFIRGKPIRFGYKMWVLTTPLGYVLLFESDQGARGRQTWYGGISGDRSDSQASRRDWKLIPPDV